MNTRRKFTPAEQKAVLQNTLELTVIGLERIDAKNYKGAATTFEMVSEFCALLATFKPPP